jgi:hypothetical protein
MKNLQEKPDPPFVMPNGSEVMPVATLKDDCGGVSHIIVDDSCFDVLVNGGTSRQFRIPSHWFDEAVEALSRFPKPTTEEKLVFSRMRTR